MHLTKKSAGVIFISTYDIIGEKMASLKQLEEKKDNISLIVSYIRSKGAVTRRQVCSELSLSWACVSNLVAFLIEEGVLLETLQEVNSEVKGRPSTVLTLNKDKYFLGIDINDAGIAITKLSINGEKLSSKKWQEAFFDTEEELTDAVCDKIATMLCDKSDCLGIGVAMEGLPSSSGGYYFPFNGGSKLVQPDKFIKKRFDLSVVVRHDPECMLYSALNQTVQDCVLVRVDKWIGIAVMKNGKILDIPIELGRVQCGEDRLIDIYNACKKTRDYSRFAKALGQAVGNLAVLLCIDKCYISGSIMNYFDKISCEFKTAFSGVNSKIKYEEIHSPDASEGASMLVMSKYPITNN